MPWIDDLAAQIDWQHPDLAATAGESSPGAQALAVIRAIRSHESAWFGFSEGYLEQLQAAATEDDRAAARARLAKAFAGDLFFPPHSNAFAALGPETLALALDEAGAERLAATVLARQADWGRNIWTFGITWGVASLLRYLCPLPVCRDEHLLPLFGWLTAIAPVEHTSARSWDERILGASGHNWFVHSLFGLWTAGALFPHFRPLQPYSALAPYYLEREAHLLFRDDGWSKEGAAGYHLFAARNLFAFARLAERHEVPLSAGFHQKLRTIADASWRLVGPDGDFPLFGDASPSGGGSALKPTVLPDPSFGFLARVLAARFGLPEAKGAAEAFAPAPPPSFLPDNGDNLADAYRALPASPPPLAAALPTSGLYVMRSDWTPQADWLAINALTVGPVVTSHQHADPLNIELAVGGRRLLVDNWYGDVTADDGSYESIPEIRNNPMKRRWRVGSSAHNVVTVDDEDIVPVKQIYRYGWNESPFVEAFAMTDRYGWFSGLHEAYRRLARPVAAVRRQIFWLRGDYWLLIDRLTTEPADAPTARQHFHLPTAEMTCDGSIRTTGDGPNLLLVPVSGLAGTLHLEDCPHPIGSYQNPRHLTIAATEPRPVLAVVLVPFVGDRVPTVSAQVRDVLATGEARTPWQITAIEVNLGTRRDLFVCQQQHVNEAWTCDGRGSAARVWHSATGDVHTGP